MSHARVVNVRDKLATWDVYVGRGRDPRDGTPGAWGNPFRAADGLPLDPSVLERYGAWLGEELELQGPRAERLIRRHMAGKTLGCWCAPGPCHGDVLAWVADGATIAEATARAVRRASIWLRASDDPLEHEDASAQAALVDLVAWLRAPAARRAERLTRSVRSPGLWAAPEAHWAHLRDRLAAGQGHLDAAWELLEAHA